MAKAKTADSRVGESEKRRPGRKPGSGGRKAGVPNKITASVKAAITEAFDNLGGVPSLVTWAETNPDGFYQLWGRLAPAEVTNTVKGALTVSVRIAREGRRITAG